MASLPTRSRFWHPVLQPPGLCPSRDLWADYSQCINEGQVGGGLALTSHHTQIEIIKGGGLKGRGASRWDLCMGQPDREGHLPRVLSLRSVHLQRSGYFLRFIWLAISVFITILKRRLYSATSLAGGGDLLVIIPWDQLTFLSFCPCPMLSCCSGRDTPGVSSPWGPLTCFRISPRKWI